MREGLSNEPTQPGLNSPLAAQLAAVEHLLDAPLPPKSIFDFEPPSTARPDSREFNAFVEKVVRYYEANGWDLAGIIPRLRELPGTFPATLSSSAIEGAFAILQKANFRIEPLLDALSIMQRVATLCDKVNGQHLAACAAGLFLVQSMPGSHRGALSQEICYETSLLASAGVSGRLLLEFSRTMATYGLHGKSRQHLGTDFETLHKAELPSPVMQLALDVLSLYRDRGWGVHRLLKAFHDFKGTGQEPSVLDHIVNPALEVSPWENRARAWARYEIGLGRRAHSVVSAAAHFKRLDLSSSDIALIDDCAQHYQKNAWPLGKLLEACRESAERIQRNKHPSMRGIMNFDSGLLIDRTEATKPPEALSTLKPLLNRLKADNLPLDGAIESGGWLLAQGMAAQDPLFPFLFEAVRPLIRKRDNAAFHALLRSWRTLSKFDATPQMLTNLFQTPSDGRASSRSDAAAHQQRITAHAAMRTLMRSSSAFDRASAFVAIARLTDFPIPEYSALARLTYSGYESRHFNADELKLPAFSERMAALQRRLFDWHHGFGALLFDSRRPPSKEPPLLARFGASVGKTMYINARDIGKFPGRGIAVTEVKTERILAPDTAASGKDQFHLYKEAWPFYAEAIDGLPRTSFLFTRGMVIVSSSDRQGFMLKDKFGKTEHYSLVLFNEHFHNPGQHVAFLVPTKILQAKLAGSFIEFGDYLGPAPSKTDVNERSLTPGGIMRAGDRMKLEVFDVGTPYALTRGLGGEHPLTSVRHARAAASQLQGQERELLEQYLKTIDDWQGFAIAHNNASRARILQAQGPVSDILDNSDYMKEKKKHEDSLQSCTRAYLNRLDLIRIGIANYQKGYSGISDQAPTPELAAAEDADLNISSVLMLLEAYQWHAGRELGVNAPAQYPILAVADTLNYWEVPKDPPFLLDTLNMKGTIHGRPLDFTPGAEPSDDDKFTWIAQVMPLVRDSGKTLRFYHRDVFIKQEGLQ